VRQYTFAVFVEGINMPYIPEEAREILDNDIDKLANALNSRGEFNYAITRLIHHYINKHGKRYDTLNDAIGIMDCAKMELYRHIAGPYEDLKIEQNGDVGVIGKD
jgi:hypothetical protein